MIRVGADGYIEVPRAQSLTPERRALNRLVDGGLARTVDVAVKQRGGRRGPREYLYFLSESRRGEAIIAAGKLLSVSDAKKAKDAYMRGGLKGKASTRA